MRRGRANAGIITHFAGSVSYSHASAASRSPTCTGVRVCEMRTVERMSTGTSKRSDTSKAAFAMSSASCESAGSSMGRCAALA